MIYNQVRILVTLFIVGSLGSGCGEDSADPVTSQDSGGPLGFGSPNSPVGAETNTEANPAASPAPMQDSTNPEAAATSDQDVMVTSSFEGCPDEPTFTGQVREMDAQVPDGGEAQFSPYAEDYNAGIGAVVAMMPAMEGEAEVDLVVTGATVVATDYFNENHDIPRNRTNFWIADGTGFVQVRLDWMDETIQKPDFEIRVGHKISFTAKKVSRDDYGPKIAAGESFTLDEVDQPVYIWDADRPLTEADVGRLVRVTGTISGGFISCGGSSKCWPVSFAGNTVTLRSTTNFPPANGACISFVGPVGIFGAIVQLNTTNFDWLLVYD